MNNLTDVTMERSTSIVRGDTFAPCHGTNNSTSTGMVSSRGVPITQTAPWVLPNVLSHHPTRSCTISLFLIRRVHSGIIHILVMSSLVSCAGLDLILCSQQRNIVTASGVHSLFMTLWIRIDTCMMVSFRFLWAYRLM